MSTFKGTPGRWTVESGDGELDSKARWPTAAKVLVFADDDCETHPIADASCNHSCRLEDEQEANARLIAAAPELLEVLSDMFVQGDVQVALAGNPIACEALEAKARSAIAKVLGEDQ